MKHRSVLTRLGAVVLATLLLACLLPLTAMAATPKSKDLVILHTNDVHTYIDGPMSYDVIAAIKTKLEEDYEKVLLVDAGDHLQGTAYGAMDKGQTIVALMNAAGYDYAAIGNHEFDYGMQGFLDAESAAAYTYLSINFEHIPTNSIVVGGGAIHDFGEKTAAIFGLTTPESFTKSTPAYFQDSNGNYIYDIIGGTDGKELYERTQAVAESAPADVVIALGHLGDDLSSSPWTSTEVIANTNSIDAFIDGHSHSTVPGGIVKNKDGEDVVVAQTGEYLDRLGIMIIDHDTLEISTDYIIAKEVLDPEGNPVGMELESTLYPYTDYISNPVVRAMLDTWIGEVDAALGQKVGTVNVPLRNYDDDNKRLVRKEETNTGDFAADALYYLFDNMGLDVDVAIMNGGGIRNKTAVSGDVTYKTCKEIHTFGNVACLQTITGQQLLDALEWGARTAGTAEECGGFLQVSGIIYSIDTSIESTVRQDDKGVWIGGPTGDYRVHSVKVFNKETNAYEDLDLAKKYNLAGYNYTLRDLGDGFAMFDGAVNVLDYVMEDYMVLANYIEAFPQRIVEAKNSPLLDAYDNMLLDYETLAGSGRITFEATPEILPEEDDEGIESDKEVAPETGDSVVIVLSTVVLAFAAMYAIGAGIVTKRKKTVK